MVRLDLIYVKFVGQGRGSEFKFKGGKFYFLAQSEVNLGKPVATWKNSRPELETVNKQRQQQSRQFDLE